MDVVATRRTSRRTERPLNLHRPVTFPLKQPSPRIQYSVDVINEQAHLSWRQRGQRIALRRSLPSMPPYSYEDCRCVRSVWRSRIASNTRFQVALKLCVARCGNRRSNHCANLGTIASSRSPCWVSRHSRPCCRGRALILSRLGKVSWRTAIRLTRTSFKSGQLVASARKEEGVGEGIGGQPGPHPPDE